MKYTAMAAAITLSVMTSFPAEAQWRHGGPDACRWVQRECAAKWGWGGRHYARCMERRGCFDRGGRGGGGWGINTPLGDWRFRR